MVTVRTFADNEIPPELLDTVRLFVEGAFGGRFGAEDWDHTFGGRRVIAFDDDGPVAHAAVITRTLWVGVEAFRTGYIEGVATRRESQGQGYGSMVAAAATDMVRAGFELGALSTGQHPFYRRLGWESWHGPTYVADGGQRTRTPDEDDGVMVLRFGPSASVVLDAPITCATRSGDDW